MIFQFILIVFAVFTIFRAQRQYRHKRVSRSWFLIWSGLWLVVLIAAATPRTLDHVANMVGVGRGADLFVYLSVLILFTFVFRLMTRVNRLERDITKLVRAMAIEKGKQESTDIDHIRS